MVEVTSGIVHKYAESFKRYVWDYHTGKTIELPLFEVWCDSGNIIVKIIRDEYQEVFSKELGLAQEMCAIYFMRGYYLAPEMAYPVA